MGPVSKLQSLIVNDKLTGCSNEIELPSFSTNWQVNRETFNSLIKLNEMDCYSILIDSFNKIFDRNNYGFCCRRSERSGKTFLSLKNDFFLSVWSPVSRAFFLCD